MIQSQLEEIRLKKIDLRILKNFVAEAFPKSSILRSLILAEPDNLAPQVYCNKLEIWLKLLQKER